MANQFDRNETEAKINARAWKDPAFKKRLLSDPKAALKEMGMKKIPAELQVRCEREEKGQWCIILREPPIHHERMSEEELQKIAAAGLLGHRSGCGSDCG